MLIHVADCLVNRIQIFVPLEENGTEQEHGSVISVGYHFLNIILTKKNGLLPGTLAGKSYFDDFIVKISIFKFVTSIVKENAYI